MNYRECELRKWALWWPFTPTTPTAITTKWMYGCAIATFAFMPCFGIASAIKYYNIGSATWDLYTCTKDCS